MKKTYIALAVSLLVAAGLGATGCVSGKTSGPPPVNGSGKQQGSGQQEGSSYPAEVALTVYFARFTETGAHLVPVKRTVPYTQEVARAAMLQLIAGPDAGSGLKPVIPSTVKVLGISIANGVCRLDLSKEILKDAATIGVSVTTEELLLAAVADTLTEFPAITSVKLTVEGKSEGQVEGRAVEDLWGHIGLPDQLVRDEDVIRQS